MAIAAGARPQWKRPDHGLVSWRTGTESGRCGSATTAPMLRAAYNELRRNLIMARKPSNETTSARVASLASRVLRDPRSTRAEKSAAASALTQRVRQNRK